MRKQYATFDAIFYSKRSFIRIKSVGDHFLTFCRKFMQNFVWFYFLRESALGMKGQIALQYANLVQELWSGSARVTAPLKLRVNF